MREVLAVQIYLQPLDSALDAGAPLVAGALPGRVLRIVPVDLRLVITVNADVSALSSLEAGLCLRAASANRAVMLVQRRGPEIVVTQDVPSNVWDERMGTTYGGRS